MLIDCHVHLAAFPDRTNGCFISPKMLKSPLFRFLLWKHGLDAADAARSNQQYIDDLLSELRASRHVSRAVLLGMDGVYDGRGTLDRARTDLLVSNAYVIEVAKRYPDEFLAGVSINPQRRDAVEEVERCAEAGAALVKVLPNAQGFDPGSPAYIPFYRALARHGLPLLSHVGYEFSLIGKDQSVGDPARLRVPLDEGVTVIAAHGCSNGLIVHEPFYATLLSFVSAYPHFFTDLSALTLPNRFLMLLKIRRHPELADRLLFGTDYPLSVFHLPTWGRVRMRELASIIRTTNRFDRHYRVLQCLGIATGSFEKLITRARRPSLS
jgi:predicted TIM-barrel fold metal-dependent hydrolase